ncbi:MAG: 50S ribosomal protein L6 [Bradyrhizobiaceae bacterium]|nr:50S ribosomal protein L6 [Bradyrhizobiaceae bacterium]
MSKIGKKAVPVPKGVTATLEGGRFKAKGPKGELSLALSDKVAARIEDNQISVAAKGDSKQHKAAWGLTRAMIANLVQGVEKGFEKKLEINGVGYRAQVQGKQLQLALGYSHDVVYPIPDGITVTTPKPTEIVIAGTDRQKVGQVAAEIRGFRPPEPYKGKGVKYADEYIFRKEGKKK